MPKVSYIGAGSREKSVNTDGVIFYGDLSAMQLDFWNGAISIKMFPIKQEAQEGDTKYDYKNRIQTTISVEKSVTIAKYIEELIIPACRDGIAKSIGFQTSKVNMIYISTGVEETGKVEPYISLFIEINESKIPSKMMTFKCRPERIFTNYNKTTGDYECFESYEEVFVALAQFFRNAVSVYGASEHGRALANYEKDRAEETLYTAMANKLGVNYNVTPTYVRSYGNKVDPWSETSATKGNMAETKVLDKLDNIDGLLSRIIDRKSHRISSSFWLNKKTFKEIKNLLK